MTIQTARLSDPAVRAFVSAVNAHDREAFLTLLAPGATMADDGSDRDLDEWIDREIFSSHGHIDVDKESNGGRSLLAHYSNDTWGRCAPAGTSRSRRTAGSPVSRPARPETRRTPSPNPLP